MAYQDLPIPKNDLHEKSEEERILSNDKDGSDSDCPHLLMTKHWDSVADMGQDDKVDGYKCNACHEFFTPEEAEAIQQRQHSIAL